jgi:hypothetical protein
MRNADRKQACAHRSHVPVEDGERWGTKESSAESAGADLTERPISDAPGQDSQSIRKPRHRAHYDSPVSIVQLKGSGGADEGPAGVFVDPPQAIAAASPIRLSHVLESVSNGVFMAMLTMCPVSRFHAVVSA